jgi:hypothetical protein
MFFRWRIVFSLAYVVLLYVTLLASRTAVTKVLATRRLTQLGRFWLLHLNKFSFFENSLRLVTTHKPMLTISNDIFYSGSEILKALDGA